MISGYGTGNSFFVDLQDRSGRGIDALETVTHQFIDALNQRPEVQMAYTSFSSNFPQYELDVDAAKCIRAGTTTDAVLSVISGYYGSMYVSNFNRFTKLYRVMLQAPTEYRDDMQSLDDVYVRTSGGMAPVSQFVTMRKIYGAEVLNRFNMLPPSPYRVCPTRATVPVTSSPPSRRSARRPCLPVSATSSRV